MTEAFDKHYWDSHWQQASRHGPGQEIDPNPYLSREISGLTPGTALDAGCGEGAEAIWLAEAGWQVTEADVSTEALSRAAERTSRECAAPERVGWIEADLTVWQRVGSSIWSRRTTRTRHARSWRSTYESPIGWHRAAPC